MKHSSDFLIIGGGVLGLTLALELKRRYRDCSINLIEKENAVGCHASGRNSGVLHAGIYYPKDSLKSRFTREGNIELHQFCADHDIPIRRCGKLIVTKNEAELSTLDLLDARAKANDVPIESLNEDEVKKLEPMAQTYERALFSPTTSSANPKDVMAALAKLAQAAEITLHTNTAFRKFDGQNVITTQGEFQSGYVINAAGLYADTIAKSFGFAQTSKILPFKGLYLYAKQPMIQTHIYPVPDLNYPFLGVHFTVNAQGDTKIGPTAIPALWREQYQGFDNFKFAEALDIGFRLASLFLSSNFDFKRLAMTELRKYSKKHLVKQAQALVPTCKIQDFAQWGPAGIRAQLVASDSGKLQMDFLFEGDQRSFHILNAVSPGWTCALPFSRFLCDEIDKKLV
jgi:L-2-hydroxyglutarate oxidase